MPSQPYDLVFLLAPMHYDVLYYEQCTGQPGMRHDGDSDDGDADDEDDGDDVGDDDDGLDDDDYDHDGDADRVSLLFFQVRPWRSN